MVTTPTDRHAAVDINEKNDALLATPGSPSADTPKYENAANYVKGWALWHLTLAVMSGGFMMALDNTILATAIPRITSDFNSLNDIGWYGSAYRITQMALLPTCGRIYTFYNIKWSYIILLFIFELGSVICAVAQNSITLIVGRAIAGVGAAGLMSGAAIIVSYCVPLSKRPVLMGMVSMVYGIGSVIGPLIGGAITDNSTLTWRFCFWINLPFGAVGLAQIWYTLRTPPPAVKAGLQPFEKLRQLDVPGATLLIGSVVCLSLALQWGGIVYPWSDPKVYGCLIGFALILALFLVIQQRDKNSCTVPLSLFQSRTVCASSAFMLFLQLSVTTQTYYWPIYFQSVKDSSARDSGIYMIPFAVSSTLATLAAGWMVSKIGYYVPFMWTGTPILSIGAGLFELLNAHNPASHWVGYQLISGIGFGICGQIPIIAVQVVLKKEDIPTGCVLIIFFECLGGALATSIAQNLFNDGLLKNLRRIDGVDTAAVVEAGAKDFRRLVRPELLDEVIDAFGDALRDVFWLALAGSLLALAFSAAMEWRKLSKDTEESEPSDESGSGSPT